jgi:hypothetical protein
MMNRRMIRKEKKKPKKGFVMDRKIGRKIHQRGMSYSTQLP